MYKLSTLILLLLFLLLTAGCAMKWDPAFQKQAIDRPTRISSQLFQQGEDLIPQIANKKNLQESIGIFEEVVAENPGDYNALKMLSTQTILLGTAYTDNRLEKSKLFRKAMTYAEQAMYTNSEFRTLINEGKKPWEAVHSLTAKEAEAMFFWVTALQYEFKEGMTLAQKIANLKWLERALLFLDHIETVAPDFGDGGVEFAKVICYYALPALKGGSKSKGDYYMHMAIEKGQKRLLSRWARGKYYYPILGKEQKAREDLEWVASQELDQYQDLYPWRVHFKEDAQLLLKNM